MFRWNMTIHGEATLIFENLASCWDVFSIFEYFVHNTSYHVVSDSLSGKALDSNSCSYSSNAGSTPMSSIWSTTIRLENDRFEIYDVRSCCTMPPYVEPVKLQKVKQHYTFDSCHNLQHVIQDCPTYYPQKYYTTFSRAANPKIFGALSNL